MAAVRPEQPRLPATLRFLLAWSLIAALQPVPDLPDPPVRWTAPAGCPDQDRVRSQIDALLGRPLDPSELILEGTIESTASGWTLTLETTVGTLVDQRSLEANDCSVLADAAALVAVVMLDPVQAADSIEDEAAAAEAARDEVARTPVLPPETPPAQPDPDPDPVPDAEPPRARSPFVPRVLARVRGGGEFGAIPGGTGSFDLGIALAGLGAAARLRVELLGQYSLGRDATSPNARVGIQLGTVAPRFCATLPAGPLEIPLCAGVEVGAMRADSDAPAGGTTNALWLAAHAEPGIRWSFADRLSLWVSAQVVVPVRYPDFELVDPSDSTIVEGVYRPEPVGVRGLLGLEVRLSGPAVR